MMGMIDEKQVGDLDVCKEVHLPRGSYIVPSGF